VSYLPDQEGDGGDTRDPRLGKVVAGRYRLIALIAEGGMGRVYRAEHVELHEPVVVKFLHAGLAAEPLIRQRFRLEAKALIRLHHPGVVLIHDYGEHEGDPYITLELLEGPTLGELITRSKRLSWQDAFEIFDQLLDVAAATHAAGVIHRDLKPENVIVMPRPGQRPRVTVLDFGIARLRDEDGHPDPRLTRTGAVFGTPSFMAPEQCRGRGVQPESDVYSISVMLFLALSGQLPFTAESSAELFAKQLYVAPPTLAEMGAPADLPAGLEALVARGLAKKAVDRPSAAKLQAALREIAAGRDEATRLALAQAERRDQAWQSRAERAAAFVSTSPTEVSSPALAEAPAAAVVLIWGFSAARAVALVDALAVNGLEGVVVDEAGLAAAGEVSAVLVAGTGWEPRLHRLRETPATRSTPLMVADILAAADIPALVRAGANDVALSSIPDDALLAKLLRLIRRRR
jgi:tRNA A-37 threonylcarbamoyl transferase component Bud32